MIKRSQTFKSSSFLAHYIPSKELKVGFSISRFCGGAVSRNKFKRIVRSRLHRSSIRSFHVFIKVASSLPSSNGLNQEMSLFCSNVLRVGH